MVEDYAEYHVKQATGLLGGYDVVIDQFESDRVERKIAEFNTKGEMVSNQKSSKFKPIYISDEGLELIEFLSLDCTASEGSWHSDSEIKIDKKGYVSENGQKTKNFWDGSIHADQKPLRLKIRNICGDETIWTLE